MRRAAVVAGVALAPQAAFGHLVTTGLGPFYDGASHLALSPEDILPVLALAMLAGLRGPHFGRLALAALPIAWLAGGIAGLSHGVLVVAPSIPLFFCLLLGVLLVVNPELPGVRLGGLAAFLGLLHGYQNGTAMAQDGSGALGLPGIAASLTVMVALTSAFVVSIRTGRGRAAVRFTGVLVAAGGVLIFRATSIWNGS